MLYTHIHTLYANAGIGNYIITLLLVCLYWSISRIINLRLLLHNILIYS